LSSVSKIAATSPGREPLSFRNPSFTIYPVCGLPERDQWRQMLRTSSGCLPLALRSTLATDFLTYSSGSVRSLSSTGRTACGSTFTMPRSPSTWRHAGYSRHGPCSTVGQYQRPRLDGAYRSRPAPWQPPRAFAIGRSLQPLEFGEDSIGFDTTASNKLLDVVNLSDHSYVHQA
jgi:hypothetical protein